MTNAALIQVTVVQMEKKLYFFGIFSRAFKSFLSPPLQKNVANFFFLSFQFWPQIIMNKNLGIKCIKMPNHECRTCLNTNLNCSLTSRSIPGIEIKFYGTKCLTENQPFS